MRTVWLTVADAMERYSGASSLTRRVTGAMAFGHRDCVLVTRSVREEASVHGQASYSTLDMIGRSDRANGMVDGDLCNGALLWRFLAYASGYWFPWPVAIGGVC
jgi:hypothetical protein